jgi:citrate lyase subunit beta/citryl-CoA lyase
MPTLDPDLRRTWLFGPGADSTPHDAMLASGADVLIVDLEDFTPSNLRERARKMLADFVKRLPRVLSHGCRSRQRA